MIARHNLCSNPSAEVDLTGWGKTNSQVTITQDTVPNPSGGGTKSIRVDMVSGTTAGQGIFSPTFNVVAGTNYVASTWIDVTTALSITHKIAFQWKDNTGTIISTSSTGSTFIGVGAATITESAVAPAGAVTARVFVHPTGTTTAAGTFWMDTLLVEATSTVQSYFDGSTPADAFYTYSWDGTAQLSTSTATPNGPTPPPAAVRVYPYPDLRNGVTVQHISDTHFGTLYFSTFQPNWMDRAQQDITDMAVMNFGGHIHTGDMCNWFVDTAGGESGHQAEIDAETNAYVAWRDAIKAAFGKPFGEAVGNHDLLGLNNGDGVRYGRTSQEWAESLGLSLPYNAYDYGDFRILTLAPYAWIPDTPPNAPMNNLLIPDSTLDWFENELASDSRPTFGATHVTFQEQYGDSIASSINTTNHQRIYDLIAAYPNLIGWLSGHRHNGIANAQWAEVMTISGRQLFVVCGPGGGSGLSAGGNAYSQGQFGSHIFTTYWTLLDEFTMDIRFRDHLARSWSTAVGQEKHRLLTRAA